MRYISGQVGQGVESARESGGRGMISSWTTDCGALAVGGAEAVGAGVAAADDDDVLAGRRRSASLQVALLHPVRRLEVLHRQVDAVELVPGNRQVASGGRTDGQHHRVVEVAQFLHAQVGPDVAAR